MSTWVRTAVSGTPDTYHSYLNLDHAIQAVVIPVTGGYSIEFGGEASVDLGSIYGRWDNAADANNALRLLLNGMDLGATEGEEIT